MAHYRALDWCYTDIQESMVLVGGDRLLGIIGMLQMLVRGIIRYEHLEDRLQEARIERERYMDEAELAVLLFLVSAFACQGLVVTSAMTPSLEQGQEQSGLMGQWRKTENCLYEATGSCIEIK
jgi:hypothetical protein